MCASPTSFGLLPIHSWLDQHAIHARTALTPLASLSRMLSTTNIKTLTFLTEEGRKTLVKPTAKREISLTLSHSPPFPPSPTQGKPPKKHNKIIPNPQKVHCKKPKGISKDRRKRERSRLRKSTKNPNKIRSFFSLISLLIYLGFALVESNLLIVLPFQPSINRTNNNKNNHHQALKQRE